MLLIKICMSVYGNRPHSSVSTLANSSFVWGGFSPSQILCPRLSQRRTMGAKLGEKASHGNTKPFQHEGSPRWVRWSAVERCHAEKFENRGVARRTKQRAPRGHSKYSARQYDYPPVFCGEMKHWPISSRLVRPKHRFHEAVRAFAIYASDRHVCQYKIWARLGMNKNILVPLGPLNTLTSLCLSPATANRCKNIPMKLSQTPLIMLA